MVWLAGWIQARPQWSRKRLAHELCRRWQWVGGRGRLKDFAARSLLLKLEVRGLVELPALRLYNRRPPRPPPSWASWQEPPTWEATLADIAPVQVAPVRPGTETAQRWGFYLGRYHYLGLRVVGETVGYLAVDRKGREVACLLFGAAAWRCGARDRKLGWTSLERAAPLARVANNTRFLVLPKIPTYYYTSPVLGCKSNSGCFSAAGGTARPEWTLATAA